MGTPGFSFGFLGPHPQYMEVPRLGVESELKLLAYARAIATPDPSLHHSSRQRRILNSLSDARGRTCNLMVPSRICFHCATMGTPELVVESQDTRIGCDISYGAQKIGVLADLPFFNLLSHIRHSCALIS